MPLGTDAKWYFFVVLICTPRLLAWPKKAYAFFCEYIHVKCIRPFWPTTSLKKFCPFPCAFEVRPISLLKSRSQNSALLSSPFWSVTSRHFSTLGIFYNPAGLRIAVPLRSTFQLVSLGTCHKTAGLLQALFQFRGQGEPLVNSSSSLEIRVACACPNT